MVAGWDADLDRLLAEAVAARSGEQVVELPAQLSTTAVLRLQADPDAFAAELARPMPQPPSRAARFGTRFHLWVERYFGRGWPPAAWASSSWSISTTCPTGPTPGRTTSRSCASCATPSRPAGSAGRSRTRSRRRSACWSTAGWSGAGSTRSTPTVRSEGFRFRVVDWKTSRAETADPLQLAIYRLAWAEANEVPLSEVDAVFYYVRTDELVRPPRPAGPGRSCERLLAGVG